jgi:broad specificity phosphatase PhoE
MYNVGGQIGGDSDLSPRGQQYSKMLPSLILDNVGDAPLQVWTSTLRRTIQTAQHLPYPKKTWKSLDELDAGVCDGMTYEEIEERYPEDYRNRDDDKFNYRYRGGESYRDVVVRLEPVIMELERQENILIIGHQAIIRCLYAYYQGHAQDQLPYISIPLHTLIKLTPKAYGCDEERCALYALVAESLAQRRNCSLTTHLSRSALSAIRCRSPLSTRIGLSRRRARRRRRRRLRSRACTATRCCGRSRRVPRAGLAARS